MCCGVPQVEEPYDPERSFYYPLQLDFSLDRDVWDEEGFDVEDCEESVQQSDSNTTTLW